MGKIKMIIFCRIKKDADFWLKATEFKGNFKICEINTDRNRTYFYKIEWLSKL